MSDVIAKETKEKYSDVLVAADRVINSEHHSMDSYMYLFALTIYQLIEEDITDRDKQIEELEDDLQQLRTELYYSS